MGVSFGVQRSYTVRPQIKFYTMLCFRPKIAVIFGDRWAVPDPSGTCSLICLHVWKVLDIRLNICEGYCVTQHALSEKVWPNLAVEKQWNWGL